MSLSDALIKAAQTHSNFVCVLIVKEHVIVELYKSCLLGHCQPNLSQLTI